MWPACVSSLIFLNVDPGRLLLGVLLPFSLLDGSSVLWRVSCSSFFILDQISGQGTCLKFLSKFYLFILFSYLLK